MPMDFWMYFSTASVFTIWIARVVESEEAQYNGFTKFNLFYFDRYWCERWFIESSCLKDATVYNNCAADMNHISNCGKAKRLEA